MDTVECRCAKYQAAAEQRIAARVKMRMATHRRRECKFSVMLDAELAGQKDDCWGEAT